MGKDAAPGAGKVIVPAIHVQLVSDTKADGTSRSRSPGRPQEPRRPDSRSRGRSPSLEVVDRAGPQEAASSGSRQLAASSDSTSRPIVGIGGAGAAAIDAGGQLEAPMEARGAATSSNSAKAPQRAPPALTLYPPSPQPTPDQGTSWWECVDKTGVGIRKTANHAGEQTGDGVRPGDVFEVSETQAEQNGMLYLKLADGRGWVFNTKPGEGVLCRKLDAKPPDEILSPLTANPETLRTRRGCNQRLEALGDKLRRCEGYTVVKRPVCMIVIMQLALWGICGVFFKGGTLNTDFSSFTRASSNSSLNSDAFTHAWTLSENAPLKTSEEESVRLRRRLQAQGVLADYSHSIVHLIYHCEGCNMLDEDRMYAIKKFESDLRSTAGWQEACRDPATPIQENAFQTCDPGETMVNYLWPQVLPEGTKAEFEFDSEGRGCVGTASAVDLGSQDTVDDCRLECLKVGGDACNKFIYGKNAQEKTCWWDKMADCAEEASSVQSDDADHDMYFRKAQSPFSAATFGSSPWRFNGRGSMRQPAKFSLWSLKSETDAELYDRVNRMLPEDFELDWGSEQESSDLLRSHFLFSVSFSAYEGTGARFTSPTKASNWFEAYLEDTLHGLLIQDHDELEELGIKLYYYSTPLDKIDIFHALWSDCRLAVGGMAAVLVIMRVHTGSTPLALFGLFLVLECIPVGYVFFKQFSGLEETGIINCLALFVIIGIGADLVFVINDGFKASKDTVVSAEPVLDSSWRLDSEDECRWMKERLVQVIRRTGASCLTTTLCAGSSFLVNLGSALGPLREFGLFMGLCVLWSLALQVSMFPLALVAVEQRARRRAAASQASEQSPFSFPATSVVPTPPTPPQRVTQPAGNQLQLPQRADDRSQTIVSASGEASEVAPTSPTRKQLKKALKSRTVKFFHGPLTDFLSEYRYQILAAFALLFLVGFIGAAATVDIDGSMPQIFPESHNQVKGKELKARFNSMHDELASAPTNMNSWKCSITAPAVFGKCQDTHTSCSSWAALGYCDSMPAMEAHCRKTCGLCSKCIAQSCKTREEPEQTQGTTGTCQCFQANGTTPNLQGATSVRATFFGVDFEGTQISEAWDEVRPAFAELLRGGGANFQVDSSSYARERPPLLQQHWRSGSGAAWPSFDSPTYSIDGVAVQEPESTERLYCYCNGVKQCDDTAESKQVFQYAGTSTFTSTTPVPADAVGAEDGGRRLGLARAPMMQPRRLSAVSPAVVKVVWGIQVRRLGPLELFAQTATEQYWDLDPFFEPSNPWAQRSMMSMCENMPKDLQVLGPVNADGTWLQAFETFLKGQNKNFPSDDFDEDLTDFLVRSPDYEANFMVDGAGKILATVVEFNLDMGDYAAIDKTLDAKEKWTEYVQERNSVASMHARGAWHTSSLWVRADAQAGILNSTVMTIGISVAIGFAAAAIFTKSIWLAGLAMVSIVMIIVSMLFFMCCVMGWTMGAVEVVALIVFLGYMFTFNLHIVHAYIHMPMSKTPEPLLLTRDVDEDSEDSETKEEKLRKEIDAERCKRARYALTAMGRSLLGSSTTSVGCALFLLFCTLQFFVTFGVVILLVTTLSLIYSLIFLPTLLMVAGPTTKSCQALTAWLAELVNAPAWGGREQDYVASDDDQDFDEPSEAAEGHDEAHGELSPTKGQAHLSLENTLSTQPPGEMHFTLNTDDEAARQQLGASHIYLNYEEEEV